MERKKGIPLVALIIFIGLLVAIILTCVIILGTNKNKDKSENTPVAQELEPTETIVEEDTGEELTDEDAINSDSDIQKAYKATGNGKTFAKYAIYESGGFNTDEDEITDEFKLQLAMAQVTNADMDKQSTKKSVPKEAIEGYVAQIWGEETEVEYKDFTLYSSDTNFTSQYKTTGYVYKKDSASYELNESDIEEENPSEISELITKVVKYNSKIEIYVKPIFVETIYDSESSRYIRSLYKNYEFTSKQYPLSENIMAITNDDYESVLKSSYNQDVDGLNYGEVNANIDLNQLTEYKYTLVKSGDNYNLKSFEKVEISKPATNNDDKEMTEQEKAKFNEQFDTYTGNGKTGADINKLLDKVVESNETYTEKTELIVSVTFNDEKIELEDDDVEALNEKIAEITEQIDNDKLYTAKPVYKTGLILSLTITEETSETD